MEQDTSHGSDFGLPDSVTDLLSLENGDVEGEAGSVAASSQVLSQGDLEALASIQEELDKFGSASGIDHLNSNPGLVSDVGAASINLGGLLNQDPVISESLAPGPSSLASVKLSDIRPSVRVVKRPATGNIGPVYNKVRIGETGQQFRIVGGGAGGLSNVLSIGGQQIKIVSPGAGVSGNLKTIVPSEGHGLGGNTISIVNRDGSFSSLPVTSGPGVKIAASQMLQTGAVKIATKPQQIRILPNQPQTFKILNSDGSLSDISSSIIRPASDLKTLSSDSSPKKKGGTFSLKSPQKMQLLKPEAGHLVKTSDGRILMGPTKKVIIPGSGASISPTKIVFRDPSGKTVNGSVVMRSEVPGGNNIVIKPPEAEAARTGPGGGQLIRLTPEVVSSLAQGAGDTKVQFVRVVAGAGTGLQTVQVKGGQAVLNNLQGVRGTVGTNSIKEEMEENKPDLKPQFVESLSKEKPRPLTAIEPQGVRPRKPCNCTKSQCLKLYCDCFANGEFCFNCNCNNCLNNLQNEEERQRAIKQCLDRNPDAFKPKIGKNTSQGDRRHNKGCNCKRSGCLKNYCECYEAKIPCTQHCKCVGCKNVDTETGSKVTCSPLKRPVGVAGGGQLDGAEPGQRTVGVAETRWFKPSTSLKSKLLQANSPLDAIEKGVKQQPFGFLTQEVVEATTQCLLAEAEEGEKTCNVEQETEKRVLEEFGRCLAQIIEFSGKFKKTSSLLQ